MASITINAPASSGFLYSNPRTARLCISAETPEFDNELIQSWRDEGFDVVYVPFNEGGKDYVGRLMSVKDGLGVGDNYAVIAFGDAASFCLDYYLKPNNVSRLCALIAYYPTTIPDTRSRFPLSPRILTHLAGNTIDVTIVPTMLGLQGKTRQETRQINPGIGTGERINIGHRAYTYADAQPGFAEQDLEEYDRLAAELAWTRSLQELRKAFGREADLEEPWEEHLQSRFFSLDLSNTMDQYVNKNHTPIVTCGPTLTGGIGAQSLRRFYDQHFLRTLPPSMHLRLISRTIGSDRVVDELFVSFEHTKEVPWMLPGVAPTNRRVEVVIVSIVSLRGGKLYSEHVYWDQASVLVQIGLLDPKLLPQGVQGVDRLPVIGREAANRILKESPETEEREYHNRLINRGKPRRKGRSKSHEEGQQPEAEAEAAVKSTDEGKAPTQPESKAEDNATPQSGEVEAH